MADKSLTATGPGSDCLWPDWCGASDLCAECAVGGKAMGECPHGHTNTGCVECGYEPPSQWWLYTTELGEPPDEWAERANAFGFSMRDLMRIYSPASRIEAMATRESPILAALRAHA